MKKFILVLNYCLLFLIVLLISNLISINNIKYYKGYRLAKDGLIYVGNSHQLYTGIIIDTSSVIVTFDVVKGVKNGKFETFYLDGKLEGSGHVANNKNEGEWDYFYQNGQIACKGNFKNNFPDGRWETYFENGKLRSSGILQSGKMTGLWKFYDEKGRLINYIFYKNGFFLDKAFNGV